MTGFAFNMAGETAARVASAYSQPPNVWANTGQILSVGGAMLQAVGSYYAARSAKVQAKSIALSLEFEQSMAAQNARVAEDDAAAILDDAQEQIAFLGMQVGQEKATLRTQSGARNVQGNAGSAAEVQASKELMKQIDSLTINRNAVRAANARRMQAVNQRNQGLMAGVGAANARASARAISAPAAAIAPLLGGAADYANRSASSYYGRRR